MSPDQFRCFGCANKHVTALVAFGSDNEFTLSIRVLNLENEQLKKNDVPRLTHRNGDLLNIDIGQWWEHDVYIVPACSGLIDNDWAGLTKMSIDAAGTDQNGNPFVVFNCQSDVQFNKWNNVNPGGDQAKLTIRITNGAQSYAEGR